MGNQVNPSSLGEECDAAFLLSSMEKVKNQKT